MNLFWITLILGNFILECIICESFSRPKNCGENTAITAGILSTHKVPDIQTCQRKCENDPKCVGFNIEKPNNKKCVLSSAIAGPEGAKLGYRRDFVYEEKISGDANSFHTSSCSSATGCKPVLKFDNHVNIVSRRDTYGYWGRDTWPGATDDYYYEQAHYNNRNQLYEYTSLQNFKNDVYTTITLPFGCDGTNHLVYKRFWYCGGHNTNQVYTYDLDKRSQSKTISFANVEGKVGSYRNQCSYHFSAFSDIDMASDDYGLWVIWARYNEDCAFAISKIDHETKTIVRSWFPPRGIELNHDNYGNAFMVCGNMYVKDHYHYRNTYVRWIYYTGNSSWVEISSSDPNRIILENYNGHNSYINYSPRDNKVYAWENTQHNTYLAHFKNWS